MNTIWDFSGRRVVVTGASRGIGHEVALHFARARAAVTVLADTGEIEATSRSISMETGSTVTPLICDVADHRAVAAALSSCEQIDILVSNAGIGDITSIDDSSDATVELVERIIRVNLLGAINVVRAALPRMISGGRIIFTSSVNGQSIAPPKMGAYTASKGGLDALMRSLARELGPRGITVNAVAPGVVATELFLSAVGRLFAAQLGQSGDMDDAAMIREINEGQAIHNKPVDISRLAESYLFLASDAGAAITGQTLNVDHGLVMS